MNVLRAVNVLIRVPPNGFRSFSEGFADTAPTGERAAIVCPAGTSEAGTICGFCPMDLAIIFRSKSRISFWRRTAGSFSARRSSAVRKTEVSPGIAHNAAGW